MLRRYIAARRRYPNQQQYIAARRRCPAPPPTAVSHVTATAPSPLLLGRKGGEDGGRGRRGSLRSDLMLDAPVSSSLHPHSSAFLHHQFTDRLQCFLGPAPAPRLVKIHGEEEHREKKKKEGYKEGEHHGHISSSSDNN